MDKIMSLVLPDHLVFLKIIARASKESGLPAFVIGGYVRDLLLERPCKDIDIVCLGDGLVLAENAAELFRQAGYEVSQVAFFKNFGTAMFKAGDVEFEFVGARQESYQSHSRKPSVKGGTLQDDQNRRDFTINALAISLNTADFGQLIDPFDGLSDLKNQIIRTPLANAELTFSDDPLRMLRAVRFATQLNFTIDPQTFESIVKNSKRLSIISAERIRDEINKILATPKPSGGFKLLYNSGLLHLFLPELAAMQGVEKKNGLSHKDNFYHTLQVLDNLCLLSDNLWLRWAALLHDIGKPITKRFEEDKGWTFHSHETVGAHMVNTIFNRLKLPLNESLTFVRKMVALHQRPVLLTKEEISDSAIRRLLFDVGEDIDELMLLCRADITSSSENKVKRYLANYAELMQKMNEVEAKDQLRNWQPPISGDLIMQTFNIKPSKEVGIIKTAIREAILDGIISNDYQEAYNYMLVQGAKLNLRPIT